MEREQLDRVSLELIKSASRFTRLAGRVPGVVYSSIAWRVLSDLESDGPARVSELAQRQRVAQPTMTALVQRLEGEGWVDRHPDPADGRAALLAITRDGDRALDEYRRAAAGRITPHLAELGEADQLALARAAELMQSLGERIGDPRT